MASYLEKARVVWTGHTHHEWHFKRAIHGISDQGNPYIERMHFVKTPGYKDEFSCGEGWHVERGAPPKSTGAAWLHFFYRRNRIRLEVLEAEEH